MTIFFSVLGALALLFLILVFLTSPASRTHTDRKLLSSHFIAHRGLHNAEKGIPENSLLSYCHAIKENLAIEIDIHLTGDGKVISFHDNSTKRMCGIDLKIEETNLEYLKKLRLLNTEERIPTLEEVLDTVQGKVFLLIEFKVVNGNAKALCQAANEILSQYKGDYMIQSFYPQVLQWYKKNNKNICRGQLASKFNGKKYNLTQKILGRQLFNFLGRPDFISYKHQDYRCLLFRFAVWLGALPVGWTFRSTDELAKNKAYFDAWIFEGFELY